MAEGKKKIVVYADWINNFEDLTDEELGKLMRHFFEYINDMDPQLEDRLLKIAWKPIQATLKRDLKKWESYVDKQKANGKLGGRPKTQKTQGLNKKPKKADSVSVSDSVSDTIIDNSIMLDIKPEDVPKEELIYFKIAKGLLNFFIEHRKYRGLKVQKYLKEAKYGSYVTPIRLLVENDGYDLEDVKETARYLISDKVDDHFYKDVVLSTDKFRKQFENIQIKRMKYLRKLELKKQNEKKGML